MSKFLKNIKDAEEFFSHALEMSPIFYEIHIADLRQNEIFFLQRISEAANHDGICIVLGVDFYTRRLIALHYLLDKKSDSDFEYGHVPDSMVYISNDLAPDIVERSLRDLSQRYLELKASLYQVHFDETNVSIEEFNNENGRAKLAHEAFMRKNNLHFTSIPADYKNFWQREKKPARKRSGGDVGETKL